MAVDATTAKRNWRHRNPEKAKAHRARYEKRHPEKVKASRKRRQEAWKKRLWGEALEAYGALCACCGEERLEFLTIDHVGGRDDEHKKLTTASVLVRVRDEGFPDTYRILCFNCNCSHGLHGYCPHEREAAKEAA